MNLLVGAIFAYVALQMLIGVLVSRSIRTEDDYLLAGRQLGPALATFSIFATWFGAETCVGSAGAVYETGLSATRADPFGYALVIVILAAVFAGPLWRAQITTLGDLFRRRYSPRVEQVAVVLMIPTSILWAGAQIRAFGQVLASASDGMSASVGHRRGHRHGARLHDLRRAAGRRLDRFAPGHRAGRRPARRDRCWWSTASAGLAPRSPRSRPHTGPGARRGRRPSKC